MSCPICESDVGVKYWCDACDAAFDREVSRRAPLTAIAAWAAKRAREAERRANVAWFESDRAKRKAGG